MIFPIVCFSCGKNISQLYKPYRNLVLKIIKEREKLMADNPNKEYEFDNSPEYEALNQLNINRICCRKHFICHQPMVRYIV